MRVQATDDQDALKVAVIDTIRKNFPGTKPKFISQQLRAALATIGRRYEVIPESTRNLLAGVCENEPAWPDANDLQWLIDYQDRHGDDEISFLPDLGCYMAIDTYGTRRCYKNGVGYHREDGPAVEWGDGAKEWYDHGKNTALMDQP